MSVRLPPPVRPEPAPRLLRRPEGLLLRRVDVYESDENRRRPLDASWNAMLSEDGTTFYWADGGSVFRKSISRFIRAGFVDAFEVNIYSPDSRSHLSMERWSAPHPRHFLLRLTPLGKANLVVFNASTDVAGYASGEQREDFDL